MEHDVVRQRAALLDEEVEGGTHVGEHVGEARDGTLGLRDAAEVEA